MNVCPNCKQSHDSTACPTPNGEEVDSDTLVADLVLIQWGWRTLSEQKRFQAAQVRLAKAARKIHLQAELDNLG